MVKEMDLFAPADIAEKGLPTIREHARQIIAKSLAPAFIPNDGKQTPMRHGTHGR